MKTKEYQIKTGGITNNSEETSAVSSIVMDINGFNRREHVGI